MWMSHSIALTATRARNQNRRPSQDRFHRIFFFVWQNTTVSSSVAWANLNKGKKFNPINRCDRSTNSDADRIHCCGFIFGRANTKFAHQQNRQSWESVPNPEIHCHPKIEWKHHPSDTRIFVWCADFCKPSGIIQFNWAERGEERKRERGKDLSEIFHSIELLPATENKSNWNKTPTDSKNANHFP